MSARRALVFAQRADADALAARLDAALGYPRAGLAIGAGRHAPPDVGRTLHHAPVWQHPARDAWVVPIDDAAASLLTEVERARLAPLGADWHPVGGPLSAPLPTPSIAGS